MAKPDKIPDGAGIPKGLTETERIALGLYLGWLTGFAGHDRKMTDRATSAKAWCEKNAP